MNDVVKTTGQFRERWLNPRRKRFWAIVLVLLYTLVGFFLAPYLIKNAVVDLFQEDLGRVATIEKVKVNPYVLSLQVQGLDVADKDSVRLLSFDDFFINFQLSSLFKWAWVFDEVRLDAPYLHFERFKSGESRMQHLLEDLATAFPPDPDEAGQEPDDGEEDSALSLLIYNLSINNGHLKAKDNVPQGGVEINLQPITVSVQELNTLPDMLGEQKVEIMLPNDGRLSWSGNLNLAPFHSEGRLALKNLKFNRAVAYLKSILPLEVVNGRLSSQFKYQLSMNVDAGFTLQVDDLQAQLDEVVVSGLSPSAEFVSIPQISLSAGKVRFPERSLQFGQLAIQQPALKAWRNADDSISFMDLVPDASAQVASNDADANQAPWSLLIEEATIDAANIALQDNSVEPATSITLTELTVKATQVSNSDGAIIPLELTGSLAQGGSYSLAADLSVLPAFSISASATTTQIPLQLAQAYVQPYAHIEIIDGALNSDVKIDLPDMANLSASGSIDITQLDINDTIGNQKLVGWSLLDIDQFEYSGDMVRFSQLDFTEPFGQLVINQDRSTNLAAILAPQTTEGRSAETSSADTISDKTSPGENTSTGSTSGGSSSTSTTSVEASSTVAGEPMVIIIGGIIVNDGAMNFADLSLPLPFSTHIAALNGTISTIATNSATPADIKLEGQVNEYGLARIDGSMNTFDPLKFIDVKVEFRNLLMADLSPYTVEFAGREIDEGKLSLGLVYNIKEGQLNGANDIVLSDLVLGKKVDHPGAASLPLGLAVALLKDSDGVIQVDLPVQGDINDPEFKIGGVIWKAIGNLITKIVTAPFAFLGSLIGVDSEDLGQFEFLAGRSDLTPPELEKIAQLQTALQERPELVVEIAGVTDNNIDIPALKKIQLRQTLNERLGEGLVGDEDQSAMMLDERIRNMVDEMFTERFPDVDTAPLKASHEVAPADDPEAQPQLDELAYATDLWNQMLEAEPVSDEDLKALSIARATVISDAFLAGGEFDAKRVIIVEPKQVTSEDGEWVVLELGVAPD